MLEVPGELERRDSVLTGSSVEPASRLAGRREKWKERLNTELLAAVAEDDLQAVNRLLESGASPLAQCRMSLTSAAHLAAAHGFTSILALLLDRSQEAIEARDRAGRQPHHLATGAGNTEALQVVLCAFPQLVNSQIQPLPPTQAPVQGSLDSWNHPHSEFKCLVPNATGVGKTALHLASEKSDWKMVELLLALGASPAIPDMNGLKPLDVVGQYSETNDQKFVPSNEPFTRATFMSQPGGYTANLDGSDGAEGRPTERVCSLLTEKGAEYPKAQVIVKDGVVVNQRQMKTTALHTAASKCDGQLISYLLEHGACPMRWNERGLTAVHLAITRRSTESLRPLLDAGLEVRDVHGRTPLLQAVEEGWADGVALILEAGAELTSTTNTSQTVLHLAALNGNATILEELLSLPEVYKVLDRTNGNHETPLCLAVKEQHLDCVSLLCSSGADTKFLMLPGDQSLLHMSVQNNSPEILQMLLSRPGRERVDLLSKEERGGETALHLAAAKGHLECAEELLSAGANLRLSSRRGDTALHLAAKAGHTELVDLLVRRDPGSLVDRDSAGREPIHLAAAEGRADCVRRMLLHGADLSATAPSELGEQTALALICTSLTDPADFLQQIFDEFVEVIHGPINDPDCEILMRFEILMPDGNCEKQMKVIGAIMNYERQSIKDSVMLHPLIECFLYLKWNKFKLFFIFLMLLYLILTITLTINAHLTFVERNSTNLYKAVSIVSRGVLLFVLVPIIFVELVNLCQLQRHYLSDYETWVKWTVIVFTCVADSVSPSVFWAKYLVSTAVLLSWVEMLFLLSRCPSWGFYVLMFSRVSVKILKILATFSFLIIGFAFSFLILFEGKVPFRNLVEAVVKVLVMMVEFDYEDMFEGVTGSLFSVVGRLMFAVFVLLVAMVMMNLIVGVAVSDIGRLEAQGRTQQLSKQAAFLAFLERMLYSPNLKRLPQSWNRILKPRALPGSVVIKPGKPSASQVHLPRSHLENLLFSLKTRQMAKNNVSESLKDIADGIDRIAAGLRELYADQRKSPIFRSSKELENMLSLILEEQKSIREHVTKSATKEKLYSKSSHYLSPKGNSTSPVYQLI